MVGRQAKLFKVVVCKEPVVDLVSTPRLVKRSKFVKRGPPPAFVLSAEEPVKISSQFADQFEDAGLMPAQRPRALGWHRTEVFRVWILERVSERENGIHGG